METKKKKLSKKKVIIGSVILAVVLFGVGYGLLYYYAYIWEPKEKEKFTFEEITQGLSEQISYSKRHIKIPIKKITGMMYNRIG